MLSSDQFDTVISLLSLIACELALIGGYFFFDIIYKMILKYMDKK